MTIYYLRRNLEWLPVLHFTSLFDHKIQFFTFLLFSSFGTSFYLWVSEPTPSSQHLFNIPKSLSCLAPITPSPSTPHFLHLFLFLPPPPCLFLLLLLLASWCWMLSLPLLTFLVNKLKIHHMLGIKKKVLFSAAWRALVLAVFSSFQNASPCPSKFLLPLFTETGCLTVPSSFSIISFFHQSVFFFFSSQPTVSSPPFSVWGSFC